MQTMPSSLTITPIPAFEDNYIWCIEDVKSDTFIVVDPGDAHVVIEHAIKIERKLSAILVTHHHADHTGGIADLVNILESYLFSDLLKVRTLGQPRALSKVIPSMYLVQSLRSLKFLDIR